MAGPLPTLHMANSPSDISKLLFTKTYISSQLPNALHFLHFHYALSPPLLKSGILGLPLSSFLSSLSRNPKTPPLYLCLAIGLQQLYFPIKTNRRQGSLNVDSLVICRATDNVIQTTLDQTHNNILVFGHVQRILNPIYLGSLKLYTLSECASISVCVYVCV